MSNANEWNPAISADGGGRVTIAWDSYRNGDYDIFARTATAPGKWEKETALVATPLQEYRVRRQSICHSQSGEPFVMQWS